VGGQDNHQDDHIYKVVREVLNGRLDDLATETRRIAKEISDEVKEYRSTMDSRLGAGAETFRAIEGRQERLAQRTAEMEHTLNAITIDFSKQLSVIQSRQDEVLKMLKQPTRARDWKATFPWKFSIGTGGAVIVLIVALLLGQQDSLLPLMTSIVNVIPGVQVGP